MSALHAHMATVAAYIRQPGTAALPPGITQARLDVHAELVRNNLDSLLAGNFPVIRKTLGDAAWQALVRRFLAEHHSHTPLFTRIGLEWIDFLQAHPDPQRPWLPELAHHEWAELGLQLLQEDVPAHDPHGDLLSGRPLLSPLAWPLAFQWPVDRIGPDHQPMQPPAQPTLLLLVREADGRVRFSRLSPLLHRMLTLLGEAVPASGNALLRQLAGEASVEADAAFMQEGTAMLQRLRTQQVLLGTRTD